MRNITFPVAVFLFAGMSLLLCKCKKASTIERVIQQKLACDVGQYTITMEGSGNSVTTGFQKTYDAQGRTVTEIACTFFEPHASGDLVNSFGIGPLHDLLVTKNDSTLILRDKNNPADTAMLVVFNKEGRPVTSITSLAGTLTDNTHFADTETFTYSGSRVFSVRMQGFSTDTVHYDSLGNLLSFAGNTYIYDYYRKPTESFYIMDNQALDHGYYLLQYLGYFPEVTNTSNIRSGLSNPGLFVLGNLGEEQYDPAERLIGFNTHFIQGYGYGGAWSTTVTYHCQ